VDVVSQRVVDRTPGSAKIDEDDLEAARALRTAVTGKKRRKKRPPAGSGVPLFYTVWFRGVGLLLLLAGAIALFVYLAAPASPQTLYERAEKLMKSEETWGDALSGPLEEYLRRYGDRQDDVTKQMRAWAFQATVQAREQKLSR